MDLIIEDKVEEKFLEVGDTVTFQDDPYICMKDFSIYELRSLCGRYSACGKRTIENLDKYVKEQNGTIYKSSEFTLKLIRKQS